MSARGRKAFKTKPRPYSQKIREWCRVCRKEQTVRLEEKAYKDLRAYCPKCDKELGKGYSFSQWAAHQDATF